MNHLLTQGGLSQQIVCDSAGTSNYHVGAPPDPRMFEAAAARGIALQSMARQFTPADFEAFDLILAMDRENFADILALDPRRQYRDKVQLMCNFCTRHSLRDVPDPYYGGPEGFDRVIDLLLDACAGLLNEIQATHV